MANCDKVSPLDRKGPFFLISTHFKKKKKANISSKTFLKVFLCPGHRQPWSPYKSSIMDLVSALREFSDPTLMKLIKVPRCESSGGGGHISLLWCED